MPRQSLDELFDAAQDIPPERRTAWLDDVCAGDDALRRELERLLVADAREQGVLEAGPALLAGVMTDAIGAPPGFGAWRVLQRLGTGGMGEVWLAERDDAGFVQRAAIKQVAWPTPGLLQRFRRERQILARLEHPGVARLIDGGMDDAGCPYLAMEYVRGERIDVWVRNHMLDVRATVRLLLQVCEAVQFAHRNLVVHSDIKPSNILMTDEGTPRLLDFGIARVLSGDDAEATRTATRLMTPDYAAPEWIEGGPVTTAVDVYALGVLAYELLSGGKPYHLARGNDVARQLADRPAQAPSAALARNTPDRRARRRALRGDLDHIVQTAMARDPARRYATVEAFSQDLRNWLDGRAVAARGDHAWYRLRKFVARNRVVVGAAALVVLTLVIATAYSLQQARRAQQQAARAERQTMRAERQLERATALRTFLTGVFEQAGPDQNQGKPFTAGDLLDKGARQLASLSGSPGLRMDVSALLATLYQAIGDYAHAKAIYATAHERLASADIPPDVKARLLTAYAGWLVDENRFRQALIEAKQAMEYAGAAGSDGVDELSAARRQLNRALVWQRNMGKAEPSVRKGLAADLAVYGERDDAVAEDYQMLGQILEELSRYPESEAAFEKSEAIVRALHGEGSDNMANLLNDHGLMLLHKGDLAKAESVLAKALSICERLFGHDNDNTRTTRSNLWRVLEYQGRFSEVLPQRLAMLQVESGKKVGARPDHMAIALNLIGADQRELGRFADAERSARDSLALWKQVEGSNRTAASSTPLQNLGLVLALQGRHIEAERVLRQALAIERASSSDASQWVNVARSRLGEALRLAGRHAQADAELAPAVARLGAINGGRSRWFAIAAAHLAENQLDSGNLRDARTNAARALEAVRAALPAGNIAYLSPLLASARVRLADRENAAAEKLLRQALAVASPPYPQTDPRILAVKVALVRALAMQDKDAEAASVRAEVEPALKASSSPYLAALRERLAMR